jgi:hypothetical protein
MPRFHVKITGKDYDAMADLVRKYKVNVAMHTVETLAKGYRIDAHATGAQLTKLEAAGYGVVRYESDAVPSALSGDAKDHPGNNFRAAGVLHSRHVTRGSTSKSGDPDARQVFPNLARKIVMRLSKCANAAVISSQFLFSTKILRTVLTSSRTSDRLCGASKSRLVLKTMKVLVDRTRRGVDQTLCASDHSQEQDELERRRLQWETTTSMLWAAKRRA